MRIRVKERQRDRKIDEKWVRETEKEINTGRERRKDGRKVERKRQKQKVGQVEKDGKEAKIERENEI